MFQKRRNVILERSHISTVIKKAIMLALTLNLQKTSVDLDNFCAGNW